MGKLIAAENIVKALGEGQEKRTILENVSVEIEEGEFVSVMGSSGSGKSTLLFAVSGMDETDSGRVLFQGRALSELKENELADLRRTKMGFIFQQPTLLKNLNLLDNIILPAMRDNRKNRSEILKRAKVLMEKTGIAELGNREITQVSGGQLQRAGICRALMSKPEILFGDEPTGALNTKSAQEIMELLCQINSEGTAIMLVTHDPKIAAQTQRIMFMCDGRLVDEMQLQKFNGTGLEDRTRRINAKMQELGI